MICNFSKFASSLCTYACLYLIAFIISGPSHVSSLCPNGCSGHGKCLVNDLCACFAGWGADSDIADYKANDCSLRTCPSDRSWARVLEISNNSHVHTPIVECSARGRCNRINGMCDCDAGFTGNACQRTKCFNDCSGHGYCVSMNKMARSKNAVPIGGSSTYGEIPTSEGLTKATWDAEKIYGCVCESTWAVGLAAGERQVPEWFGPDCSLRRCPSNDDPITTINVNAPFEALVETDCAGKSMPGVNGVGAAGNLCHVECSNRGICDYKTGNCRCFNGHHGLDCSIVSVDSMLLTVTTVVGESSAGRLQASSSAMGYTDDDL